MSEGDEVVDGDAEESTGGEDASEAEAEAESTDEAEGSEEAEASGRGLSAAWAGGSAGRLVTDAVLRALPSLLVRGSGRCYMVVEQCNQPERVVQLAEEIGLVKEQVLKRRAGRELLYVFKFFVPEACKETL